MVRFRAELYPLVRLKNFYDLQDIIAARPRHAVNALVRRNQLHSRFVIYIYNAQNGYLSLPILRTFAPRIFRSFSSLSARFASSRGYSCILGLMGMEAARARNS